MLHFFKVTEENVYSVLCFADVYLLNGLKRLCAREISTFLDPDNVVTVLRTARLFNLSKLEVDCCEYISKYLEKVTTYLSLFTGTFALSTADVRVDTMPSTVP